MWVEGLDLALERMIELAAGGDDMTQLPPVFCLVIDNPGNALVAVPLRDLAIQHRRRMREHPTDARFTFMLRRRESDYVVEGVYGGEDTPVMPLDSLGALANAIAGAKRRQAAGPAT